LNECLLHLAPAEREIIVGYFLDDPEAVGKRLGITLNALRIRVHRIRKKLEMYGLK